MSNFTVLETQSGNLLTSIGTGFGAVALLMGLLMVVVYFFEEEKNIDGNLFFGVGNCMVGITILLCTITPEGLTSVFFGLLYVASTLLGLAGIYLAIGLLLLTKNIKSTLKLAVLDNKFDNVINKIEIIDKQLTKNRSSLFRVPKFFKRKIEKANGLLLDKKVEFQKVIEAYKTDLSENRHYR